MTKQYELPNQLDGEIAELQVLIEKYKQGEISVTELKAHRVPFGVYEQREAGTYMVRIRCAAGMVTPLQLEQVALLASQYGVRDFHLTSRQELQIHYVKLDDIIAVIKQLRAMGLATRGGGGNTVRNITVPHDAGIDPKEEFDVSPYAVALTSRLIAESDSWNLPRKFKIAFSGSAEDKGYATIADLGFLANMKNGKRGFKVYAAGGLGAKSAIGKFMLDFIEEGEVYALAKAVKNVFFKYGNRKNKHAARIRFLWEVLGENEFKRRVQEEFITITQAGTAPLVIKENSASPTIDRLDNVKPRNVKDFNVWKKRFVKIQKQEGLYSILIPIELGFISCGNAIKLAQFLKPFGDDVVRLTRNQNFFLRGIPQEYLGNVFNFISETFKEARQPALYGTLLSCAGASTCQLGICLSRQAARAIFSELEKSGLDLDTLGDIKINISGCSNSCGQHEVADLGFSGRALRSGERLYPAYTVFAGAVIGDAQTKFAEHIGEIPAKALPLLVKDFLQLYSRKVGQCANFKDYLAHEGKTDLKEIILTYSVIPSFDEDKNYYFDWGAPALFSLAQRRAGECSAGFFDLLEMDLQNIKKTQAALIVEGENPARKEKLLGELVYFTSRVLLITRGVDAKNEEEVYAGFLTHFIETGLIASSFRDIIATAQRKDSKGIVARESQVHNLAETVQALYETMDNSFNFKTTVPAQESHQKEIATARVIKDFRGVTCPLNFVKTKVELARLKAGDTLEIWLDDGAPIENVPGSIKAEGHTIIEQKKIGGYWSVIIKKKE